MTFASGRALWSGELPAPEAVADHHDGLRDVARLKSTTKRRRNAEE
jgi:hypothetical protein